MAPRIGYLLPTREQVMEGRPETGAAAGAGRAGRGARLRFDLGRRFDHGAAAARAADPACRRSPARTRRAELGTAVLLPALRNPVRAGAPGIATLDQISEGRFILGVGIASDVPNIRAEFDAPAACRSKSGSAACSKGCACAARLWSGQPVNWNGRWSWRRARLGPMPHRPGGPPIWIGGMVRASLERVGRLYDGWFPNRPTPEEYRRAMAEIHAAAREAGRDPAALTGAVYLTLTIDDDTGARRRAGWTPSWRATTAGRPPRCATAPALLRRAGRGRRRLAHELGRGRRQPPRAALRRRP